jgi:predicted esterase
MKNVFLLLVVATSLLLVGCPSDNDSNESPICVGLNACAGSSGVSPLQASGVYTINSSGMQREFYLQIPDNYSATGPAKPILFAYHGTGGTYDLWLDGFYDLLDAVGDDAIVVLAQALTDHNGVNQWDFDVDYQYFEDMLATLKPRLTYDDRKIFVTGHSSGGGMAHELGCNYGDVIRGIAPHAGILKSAVCVGSVAVLQSHGVNDSLVTFGTGEAGHQFWVLYNGFEYDATKTGIDPTCINHDLADTPYPVQWCLHSEGTGEAAHDWASFASAATWAFFKALPDVAPTTEPPPGGGLGNLGPIVDTTVTFTLSYPPGIGEVTEGALSIYPAGSQQPLAGGPSSIINGGFDPGNVGAGSTATYTLPIKYVTETFPGTYAFSVIIYVADGGNPIPFPNKDHIVLRDVDLIDRNTPIIIDQTLDLEAIFF